ncbi:MAG: fatty acyl-AMP ligase [Mycobacterium sp.]
MAVRTRLEPVSHQGLLRVEDCLDRNGNIVLPPDVTLISLIERNVANVGDSVAYRYIDYTGSDDGSVTELSWSQVEVRLRAIAAQVQSLTARGDRVAVVAPQGLDYVTAFFGAIKAGAIAVPLFTPELQGHAERLETAMRDARPSAVLVTSAGVEQVEKFLAGLDGVDPLRIVVIDEVPDSAGVDFVPVDLDLDDVSHLQYTSGATRPPVGVEVTHRAVGTNLLQMILAIDLVDRKAFGVSWLPLFHDMGLSMIGFPAVYGGHSTLMSPAAFIRRPQRWISALASESDGRAITAAPNFAYEYTAQRGIPAPEDEIDLSHAVLIIGAEPVSFDAIEKFNTAFAPYGLPPTAFKPSYGIAEGTLMIAITAAGTQAKLVQFDRAQLGMGRAVPVGADHPDAIGLVPCGLVANSLWAVIVDEAGAELPDGTVGEIWLHGDNIGRGYWGRPQETERTFHARLGVRLATGSHAEGMDPQAFWLRSSDLGCYVGGELFVMGRLVDVIVMDGRQHYPQDIEAAAEASSAMVRPGHATAFTVPDSEDADERLVIISERASGTRRADPAPEVDAIVAAVAQRHGITASDVRFVPAGAIPRTTSGKLARRACRAAYLNGAFDLPPA